MMPYGVFRYRYLICILIPKANSGGATSEVAKARQAICERGQKLSEVEDRTEMMANEAKVC
jgi:hypothetical protein